MLFAIFDTQMSKIKLLFHNSNLDINKIKCNAYENAIKLYSAQYIYGERFPKWTDNDKDFDCHYDLYPRILYIRKNGSDAFLITLSSEYHFKRGMHVFWVKSLTHVRVYSIVGIYMSR